MKRKASVYIQLFQVGNPQFRIPSLGNSSGIMSSPEDSGENAEFLDEHCSSVSSCHSSCWSQHIKHIKDQKIASKITGSFFLKSPTLPVRLKEKKMRCRRKDQDPPQKLSNSRKTRGMRNPSLFLRTHQVLITSQLLQKRRRIPSSGLTGYLTGTHF